MPRILLTGANGFVGRRIKEHMPVIDCPSLRGAGQDDVRRMIDAAQPEVIIHTAAISDIAACEQNPEASWHTNVLVPTYLAKAAPQAKLLMFSSDQVYSGSISDGPYTEEETAPANLYARHKLEMEQRVLDINPSAVMLRATWMYDMPVFGVANRGNFIVNLLKAAAQNTPVAFSSRQYRGLTYAREVAVRTEEAIALPGGTYNFGSENTLSMHETAQLAAEELHLKIVIQDAEPRHQLWMDCSKLHRQGVRFMSTADALRACIRDYGL